MENIKRMTTSRTLPTRSLHSSGFILHNDTNTTKKETNSAPQLKPLAAISINTIRGTVNAFKNKLAFPPKPVLQLPPPQQTTIALVESESQLKREQDIANALAIISQSLEPSPHLLDRYRKSLLEKLENKQDPQRWYWRFSRHLLAAPFFRIRTIWHYLILPAPLFYNMGLLFALYFTTPPLVFFAVGLTLFWAKIVYELYRDVLHRDDMLYHSNVPKDLSLLAAITAGIGLILKMKAEAGEVTLQWLTQFFT